MSGNAGVVAQIAEMVTAGFVHLTKSARIGMRAHGITTSDVLDLLLAATDCEKLERGGNLTYRYEGADLGGRPIRVIVAIREGVAIVSAHLITEPGL